MTVIYEGDIEIIELMKKGSEGEVSDEDLLFFIEKWKDEKESRTC